MAGLLETANFRYEPYLSDFLVEDMPSVPLSRAVAPGKEHTRMHRPHVKIGRGDLAIQTEARTCLNRQLWAPFEV